MICISQVYFLVCFCNKTRKQMDHRKPHFDYHNWDSVWFCFQSGDGNVMFGGRQESVWLFGWPRANRQPGDGVFQWADCFLSHSFHIKLNNWIFKFVRFLLTCAAGGQQAGRIKRGSIHLKGLVTFFSYTSVHLKKKKSLIICFFGASSGPVFAEGTNTGCLGLFSYVTRCRGHIWGGHKCRVC